MISESKQVELRRNFEVFLQALPTLLPDHENEFVLMRNGEFIAYFEFAPEAVRTGRRRYDDDLFSVQEVTTRVADLGWHSRAPIKKHL